MNPLAIRALNKARRVWLGSSVPANDGPALTPECHGQAASHLIREKLLAPGPCMITRLGSTELRTVLRRWHQTRRGTIRNAWSYLRGQQGPFWWDDEVRQAIQDLSGVFPGTNEAL